MTRQRRDTYLACHAPSGPEARRTGFTLVEVVIALVILAVGVLPFVLRIVYLALNDRFEEHRRMARWVFPVWAYVSVTGLLVYILLYQVYGYV